MILTLANNFNEWTYFEPTRLIYRWTTLVQLTRRYALATSRINEIGDCAEVTFDWRHVMTTAVKRKHQKRRSITFLCSLCYKTYTKPSQRMNENDLKTKRWIWFFCCSSKYERKVNVTPWASLTLHETYCVLTSVLCFTSDLVLRNLKIWNTKREASATFW